MCGFHCAEAHTMLWKLIFLGFWGLLQKDCNFILQEKMPVLLSYVLTAISSILRQKVRGETWTEQHHSELCWWG